MRQKQQLLVAGANQEAWVDGQAALLPGESQGTSES